MNSIFFINETFTNGYRAEVLDIISLLAILCGILVIISKNPIVSVLFLIGLFLCVSTYLMLSGMTFIGIAYLVVYIGAVSILFLFILMLINVRISELQSNTNNSLPLALIIGTLLYYFLFKVYPSSDLNIINNKLIDIISSDDSSDNSESLYVTSNTWDGILMEISHIISIGNVIYTNYFIWIVIASTILLLAMVGSIIITIKS